MIRTLIVFCLFALAACDQDGSHPTVDASVFDCSAEPDIDYFYPDPAGSCDTFYRCISSNSLAYEYTCDPPLIFYENTQRCEYADQVPSTYPCGQADSTATSSPGSTFNCTGKDVGFYATEACTSTYYNCDGSNAVATAQECNSGLVVNTDTDTCDWSYNVAACNPGGTTTTIATNVVTCAVNCGGKTAGYYTDPANPCSATYYYCDGYSSACQTQHCPSGLVYDEVNGYCNWSNTVTACNP